MALVQSMLNGVHTATLVRVESVTNSGGVDGVGFVDITPLVGQLDGNGRVIDHTTIYNARYLRVQGGSNAVILDPQTGDIGLAVFCERDVSAIKRTGTQGPPGSLRKFSMADAVYCFSLLTSAPSQYVRFSGSGVEMVSPSSVKIKAPNIKLDGNTIINGPLSQGGGSNGGNASFSGNTSFSGDSVKHNGHEIGYQHTHGGVQTGGGNTGVVST